MAGVGLVWAAFLASIGLLLPAVLVVVAAAVGATWVFGVRLPRLENLRDAVRRPIPPAAAFTRRSLGVSRSGLTQLRAGGATAARSLGARTREVSARTTTAARATIVWSRDRARGLVARAGTVSRSGTRTIVPAARATIARAGATASATRARVERPRPPTEASRLARDSTYLRRQGRIAEAVEAAEEAVVRFGDDGDRRGRALASNSLGISLAKAGRHAEAIDAFDAALTLLADCGDRHHEGQVLANLGAVHRRVGGTEAARFCWTRALERLEPGTRESQRTAELLGVR